VTSNLAVPTAGKLIALQITSPSASTATAIKDPEPSTGSACEPYPEAVHSLVGINLDGSFIAIANETHSQ
jgi:hypothetical protein